jgi:CubicO group peptidase (beta-lactamase class C family)
MLAAVLERVGGATLDVLAERDLVAPLGLRDTGFRPPRHFLPRIAATEDGNEREREMAGEAGKEFRGWNRGMIWGECHDLNAWSLGGVGGNAGWFSTAPELHRMALEFLGQGTGLFTEEALSLFRGDLTPSLNENRSVGWQLAATPGAAAGPLLSPGSMGHTGFTGTSLWIDPEEGWILILLTNRIHPRYRADDMNAVRREFHRRILTGADPPRRQ